MLQLGFMPVSRDAKLCVTCLTPRFKSGGVSRGKWDASRRCKSCSDAARRKHSDRSNLAKAYNLAKFGIGIDKYNEMWLAQEGRCAACQRPEGECGSTRLAVDHDHACCPGKRSCGSCVRALLCAACNTALGLLGDDPRRIAALQAYVSSGTTGKV